MDFLALRNDYGQEVASGHNHNDYNNNFVYNIYNNNLNYSNNNNHDIYIYFVDNKLFSNRHLYRNFEHYHDHH